MNSGCDFKECLGLKVKPRQGDALLFYLMHVNGTFDKIKELFLFSM
jgi:prolyl 4-hydroxylase